MIHSNPEVECLLASKAGGSTIWTFRLRYWRAIHAEFMTHRVFSRNASSSRAIPVIKMLEAVIGAPAGPSHWGKNEKGMQATEENESRVDVPYRLREAFIKWKFLDPYDKTPWDGCATREEIWEFAASNAALTADALSAAGYHKQVVNRLTEPFQQINVIVTSTEWENFFELRDHPAAMPEFRALAQGIRAAMKAASVQYLDPGQWHIPMLIEEDGDYDLTIPDRLALSTARCAHVSYETVDAQTMTLLKAREICGKLFGAKPFHMSPTEHQAKVGFFKPMVGDSAFQKYASNLAWPWLQHRKFIECGCSIS